MTTRIWRWTGAAVLAGAMSLGLTSAAGAAWGGDGFSQPPAKKPAKDAAKDEKGGDLLIMRNGRTIEGRIKEETGTTVKILVRVGTIEAETEYAKSDILKIERGTGTAAKDPAPKPDASKAKAVKGKETGAPADDAAKKIYVIDMKGEFGRDVSTTPLRQVIADAKKSQPDILIIKMDTDFKIQGDTIPEWVNFAAGPAYNQLETVRQLQTMFTDEIRDDAEWKVKPRLVCWVHKALGGAAFLPFVCPEIYYASTGRHGGIGYLEFIFKGVGGIRAQEKQYSLRQARAEGLAEKGGHEPKLIRAMSRADYVLSVSFVGGKPVYHEDTSGEYLLTDDASEEAGRRDTIQEVARFTGNDVLTLDAGMAERLGLSLGTVDTLDALAGKMGVARDYTVINGKSDKILLEWGKEVAESERNFERLWGDFNEVKVGGTYDERQKARGKQIHILQDIKALLDKYGEAINPRTIKGAPEQWEIRINIMIEKIKTEMRLDKR